MKKLALLMLAAVAAMPLAASAAEADIYADVLSAYVYRGVVGNDEAVFQPGLDVAGPLGFGYSLWANMNLTDADSAWYPDTFGKWGEVDLGLNWTCPAEGPVSLTVGSTYFIYPQESSAVLTDEETGEPILAEDGSVQVSKAPADDGYELYLELAASDVPLAPSIRSAHAGPRRVARLCRQVLRRKQLWFRYRRRHHPRPVRRRPELRVQRKAVGRPQGQRQLLARRRTSRRRGCRGLLSEDGHLLRRRHGQLRVLIPRKRANARRQRRAFLFAPLRRGVYREETACRVNTSACRDPSSSIKAPTALVASSVKVIAAR